MIRKILVPLDGSERAEDALPHASAVARAFGARLVLLRVMDPGVDAGSVAVDSLIWRLARAEASRYLNGLLRDLERRGHRAQAEVAEGPAAEQIVRFIDAAGVDLVVLCTHGTGAATEFELGGTARKVLERAGVSVMLVPSRGAGRAEPVRARYRRILVAVDCSPRSDWATSLAAVIARAERAELVLAHVVSVPEVTGRAAGAEDGALISGVVAANQAAAEGYVNRLVAQHQAANLRVRCRMTEAHNVPRALAALAKEERADLAVLSAHGASGDDHWPYGTVAASLLGCSCGVTLVLQDLPRRAFRPVTEEEPARLGTTVAAG